MFKGISVTVKTARQLASPSINGNTKTNALIGFAEVSIAISGTPGTLDIPATPDIPLIDTLSCRINMNRGSTGDQIYVTCNHTQTNDNNASGKSFSNQLVSMNPEFSNYIMGKVVMHIAEHGWSISSDRDMAVSASIGEDPEIYKAAAAKLMQGAANIFNNVTHPATTTNSQTATQTIMDELTSGAGMPNEPAM